MFTKDQIISFCAVFDNGSFSAGARALKRDRTTIREHVIILEDNIGTALFTIEGRSAIPTAMAQKLYARARAIVRQIEEFESAALGTFDKDILTVNIYHDAMIPASMLAGIEEMTNKAYPHLQFNWLHRNRSEAMKDLVSGEAHIALMPVKNYIHPEKEVNYINLGRIPLYVYTNPNHPLTKLDSVKVSDLQQYKQYINENHYEASLKGMVVSPAYHLVSNNEIIASFLKNHGWAILSEAFAKRYCDNDELVKLKQFDIVNGFGFNACIFYSSSMEFDSTVSGVMAIISQYAKKYLD